MTSGYSKQRGFTLIELLFAIFIFTIVISSVYGAYNATFHIIHGSEATLNESHKARVALERISEDLTAFVTGPGAFLRGTEEEVSGGRGDSISFISSTHISLRENDTLHGDALIQYSSQADETNGTIRLMRSDAIRLPGATTEEASEVKFLLCSGLKEVRFTYFDKDGQETTEWETESRVQEDGTEIPPELPVMISIELIFPAQDTDKDGSNFKTAVALSRDFEE
ncbi:MAG: general secretion pathway protein J [Desulforhopalus sp.]|jgi:general secretion pathway protein J